MEEVIRDLNQDKKDADIINEQGSWEILNENNSHDVFQRHWFKQNYSINSTQESGSIIYH